MCDRLTAAATSVRLRPGDVLQELGQQPANVVFPESGAASILTPLRDGGMVEAAIVGIDGFVGVPILLGTASHTTRVMWQVPGDALRLPARDFSTIVAGRPVLPLYAYVQALHDQMAQGTACNRRHSLRQRAARWLLMVADRVAADGDEGQPLELTHEFLATMLGAGRPKVTLAAQQLQRDGLIRYRRGVITIVDRPGLIEVACECYASVAVIFPGR